MILLNPKLDCQIGEEVYDKNGKFLGARKTLDDVQIVLANLYTSNDVFYFYQDFYMICYHSRLSPKSHQHHILIKGTTSGNHETKTSPVPELSFLPAPHIGAEPGRAKR